MERFGPLLINGDVGTCQCLLPSQYEELYQFDWCSCVVRSNCALDIKSRIGKIRLKFPLSSQTLNLWLSPNFDLLTSIFFDKCFVAGRRALLAGWDNSVSNITQIVPLKRFFLLKPCSACNKKLWRCQHCPLDGSSLGATMTRRALFDLYSVLNYFRSAAHPKKLALSGFHCHRKLFNFLKLMNSNLSRSPELCMAKKQLRKFLEQLLPQHLYVWGNLEVTFRKNISTYVAVDKWKN